MTVLVQSHAAGVDIPARLLTSAGGQNTRLRVDVAQTGFFEGKEFRTFKELSIASATTLVIKAVVPINIILFLLDLDTEVGFLKVETVVGGTEGGTFSETLPLFSTNTMSEKPQPAYVQQTVLTAGGTHTGGTILDIIRSKAVDNSKRAASVGAGASDERGIGANTYYFRLVNIGADTITGVFKARWEERP